MGLMSVRLAAADQATASALAQQWGGAYGVDPLLVLAVIRVESNYDPVARGAAGEGGLMQMLPETATLLAGRTVTAADLTADPSLAVQLGTQYLRDQLTRYGSTSDAIAAYNAGTARKNSAGQYVNSQGRTIVNDYVNRVLDTYLALAGSTPDEALTVTARAAAAPAWWQDPWTLAAAAALGLVGVVVITR